jgi:hypothetical protein
MAQSIMSHACQRQITKMLSEAARVMGERSIFLATYCKGDSDYTADEWVYPKAVRFTFEFIHRAAAESSLECSPVNWAHPRQSWVIFYQPANSVFVTEKLHELQSQPSDAGSLQPAQYSPS